MKLTGNNFVCKPIRFLNNINFTNNASNNKLIKIKIKEAYKSLKSENGENMGNNIKDAHLDTILIKPLLETYDMYIYDFSGNLIDNHK